MTQKLVFFIPLHMAIKCPEFRYSHGLNPFAISKSKQRFVSLNAFFIFHSFPMYYFNSLKITCWFLKFDCLYRSLAHLCHDLSFLITIPALLNLQHSDSRIFGTFPPFPDMHGWQNVSRVQTLFFCLFVCFNSLRNSVYYKEMG